MITGNEGGLFITGVRFLEIKMRIKEEARGKFIQVHFKGGYTHRGSLTCSSVQKKKSIKSLFFTTTTTFWAYAIDRLVDFPNSTKNGNVVSSASGQQNISEEECLPVCAARSCSQTHRVTLCCRILTPLFSRFQQNSTVLFGRLRLLPVNISLVCPNTPLIGRNGLLDKANFQTTPLWNPM